MNAPVPLWIDGQAVEALPGETILDCISRLGLPEVPTRCDLKGLSREGNCRSCVVEVEGERALTPSCARRVESGMRVWAQSERSRTARQGILALLSEGWAQEQATDESHPALAFDPQKCIHCTRCIRACREWQVNDVLGMAGRGAQARVVFDQGDAIGQSSCVACGECVAACPTGALYAVQPHALDAMKPQALQSEPLAAPTRRVDSLCPYCGVGCQLQFEVARSGGEEKIIAVHGRQGPANQGRLCVKGRFGFDYVHHPDRLKVPLIRREGVPKEVRPKGEVAAPDWGGVFREATWEEALDKAAQGLKQIRQSFGSHALAGFGSAKGSNEEAYLFQKLVRVGFGTHQVDHCTRLCHASSVAALLEGVGSGAVSNPVRDVAHSEFIFVIGANPAVNHPVAASFIKNAVRRGAKLVIADPRQTELTRLAWRHLNFHPGSDVALLSSMLHVVVKEGLIDPDFIAKRTEGYEALLMDLDERSPEQMQSLTGIDPALLREVARAYAGSAASMIFWGMGISQHVHGTDNARCLIALALCTGQIGRPGTGLHPLRGQNNVQGASDAGLIPMMLPDYQKVSDPAVRARFEAHWGHALSPQPGLTVVEIIHAAAEGRIQGMYIMGENPAMSDPDLQHARAGLSNLKHLVVQDIFMTETAMLADVVLPASAFPEKEGSFTNTDRCLQHALPALAPPGQARLDLDILQDMSMRLGFASGSETGAATGSESGASEPAPGALPQRMSVGQVYEEMRACMPSLQGIPWQRLVREGAAVSPCEDVSQPGHAVLFTQTFPTLSGLARLVPVAVLPPGESVDEAYPWILITGRQLEHWHTGSMTRRSRVLDSLEPEAVVMCHPQDLQRWQLQPGQKVRVSTRRGQVELKVRADDSSAPGTLFMPFCYGEAAANMLTRDALDPFGKIPEFKYSAAHIEAA